MKNSEPVLLASPNRNPDSSQEQNICVLVVHLQPMMGHLCVLLDAVYENTSPRFELEGGSSDAPVLALGFTAPCQGTCRACQRGRGKTLVQFSTTLAAGEGVARVRSLSAPGPLAENGIEQGTTRENPLPTAKGALDVATFSLPLGCTIRLLDRTVHPAWSGFVISGGRVCRGWIYSAAISSGPPILISQAGWEELVPPRRAFVNRVP